MGALRHTINEAWDIHDRPPLLRRKALDLALVLGATIVLALSLAVTATRKAANLLDDEEGGGSSPGCSTSSATRSRSSSAAA